MTVCVLHSEIIISASVMTSLFSARDRRYFCPSQTYLKMKLTVLVSCLVALYMHTHLEWFF